MRRSTLLTLVAIAGTLLAVHLGSTAAVAGVQSFPSVKESHGVLTFKVKGLEAKRIRGARLTRSGRRALRVELRKVRRAAKRGVLRVRVPRSWRSARSPALRRTARAAHHRPRHKLQVVTDTTAPDTTITSGPSGAISSTEVSFGFTSTESNSTFECRLDQGIWSACSSPKSYSGLTAAAHNFEVRAKDAAGNLDLTPAGRSFTVESTPPPPPPPPPSDGGATTPAPFPSRLRASGRNIADENGFVMAKLKGFNMHVAPGFTWPQSHFNDIAALGGKINRAVLHWDQFERTQGVIDPTAIANLDLHIARAQAAGLYTLLELHLNVGRVPSWTSAVTGETEKYAAYGQTLTQYLAYRYGNPASAQYTKAVVGFGLNEPPLESAIRNGNNSVPWLEEKQRQMIRWMRASGHAPSWIGFVAYGYAVATPIYNDAYQNVNAVDASPTAYDTVGGNVVIDVHDYTIGVESTDPNADGRQWNGMIFPTYQGGPLISTGDSPAPSYVSSALRKGQQAAYLGPYKTFSERAQIPLMIGEWGWQRASTGELPWITDKKLAWANAGSAIEIQWNYDVTTNMSVNYWAARPGGSWTPSVREWMVSG